VTISQGGASTVSCSGSGSRFGCTGP
jgi:hypothetical protein